MNERKCSRGCGRSLFPSNKSGVCSACKWGYVPAGEKGKSVKAPRLTAGGTRGAPRDARSAALMVVPSQGGSPVDRLRAVGPLLGFDGEGVLNRFAQAWLDTLRDAALERDEASAPARRARNVTVTSQALPAPAAQKAPTVRLRANNPQGNAPVAAASAGPGESDHGSHLDDD